MSGDAGRVTLVEQAMATEYEVTVAGVPEREARQAARTALDALAPLEQELSHFIENSDISRINRLPKGGTTVVSPETFECLRVALEMQRRTGGAFDVTYKSAAGRGHERLRLDSERMAVEAVFDGVFVDLGGIGKGFALDLMAGVLREWGVNSALVKAGASTILAMDAPLGAKGWPVGFGPANDRVEFPLVCQALSASGIAVQGEHIVDPSTGRAPGGRYRAWSLAPTGAEADALSTAFMILKPDAIRGLCRRRPEYRAWFETGAETAVVRLAD